jgi:hypothetical protein
METLSLTLWGKVGWFENRMFRKLDQRGIKCQEAGARCIMKSFNVELLTKYY